MEKPRDPVCVTVGINIRRLRSAAGLTQGGLGKLLGVSGQQVQRYEAGMSLINVAMLYRLTQLFGCDMTTFFVGMSSPDAAGRIDTEMEYATLRCSRWVQGIRDRELRESVITLCRHIARIS